MRMWHRIFFMGGSALLLLGAGCTTVDLQTVLSSAVSSTKAWQQIVQTDAASSTSDTVAAPTNVIAREEERIVTNALVSHVVDGDTVDVFRDGSPEEERVRLLGVNTPETVDPRRPVECFGKMASAFTKETLEGKRVRLEEDPQADERDKYQRLLRNIILSDGTDFNAMLVARGYAYAYTSFPGSRIRKAELTRLEREAREEGRGLWATSTCAGKK
jgi:micrococcal nuclease